MSDEKRASIRLPLDSEHLPVEVDLRAVPGPVRAVGDERPVAEQRRVEDGLVAAVGLAEPMLAEGASRCGEDQGDGGDMTTDEHRGFLPERARASGL
jgi:hypothetical protein